MNEINVITGHVVSSALRIHSKLGPGLKESLYETILARDLARLGLNVERQKYVSFDFEGLWFQDAFRLDLVIERKVIVELKSVRMLHECDEKQLLPYLRILDYRVGLLINFGAPFLKDGIKRMVKSPVTSAIKGCW